MKHLLRMVWGGVVCLFLCQGIALAQDRGDDFPRTGVYYSLLLDRPRAGQQQLHVRVAALSAWNHDWIRVEYYQVMQPSLSTPPGQANVKVTGTEWINLKYVLYADEEAAPRR